ncbi:MAG: transcriptional repressor LexA [Vulcanimicrobiota bacterium]
MTDSNEAKKLTRRQKGIFNFIVKFRQRKGYSPTVREIGKGVGLSSPSTVHLHLNSLEEKGYIKKDSTKPRTIDVLITPRTDIEKSQDFPGNKIEAKKEENIPDVLEEIPVIKPQLIVPGKLMAEENIQKRIQFPRSWHSRRGSFLLVMPDDSMENAGILAGDHCFINPSGDFSNGEIYAIQLDDRLTIKKVYKYMSGFQLVSEKRGYRPLYVGEINIVGKFSGLVRFPADINN